MALNHVTIHGRFARDPELRRTQTGKAVVSFTLAVDNQGKDNGASFIPCVAWDKTGEFVNNFFQKGNAIIVEGRVESREWTDKEGHKRTTLEVIVNQAHFCEKKETNTAPKVDNNYYGQPASQFAMLDDSDEELPF